VINIVCPSFEVKNLVYIYLVRCAARARAAACVDAPPSYAEQRPDETLLSVNSFQKDLSHPNPRVRALALRVLSSIRVHVIVPVVVLAIRACARDPSPAVRKAAAHAVPKIFRIDRGREEELVEVVEALLRDGSPTVLSSAVAAFTELCPHRMDLLHAHYRKLCCLLVDTDEWGQTLLANLLLRYARTQFAPPDALPREPGPEEAEEAEAEAPGAGAGARAAAPAQAPRRREPEAGLQALLRSGGDFYADASPRAAAAAAGGEAAAAGGEAAAAPAAEAEAEAPRREGELDEDHRLLLRCSRPLLQSRSAAVVLAVSALHWYLAPAADLPRVAKALVFAARSSPEAQHALLQNVVAMARLQPRLFAPHLAAFYAAPRDSAAVRALKLECLTRCAQPPHAERLLSELQLCLRDGHPAAVVLAVRAVGRAAARLPAIAPQAVRSLMELSAHPAPEVAAEAVVVLRALVQRHPERHGSVVLRLVKRLEGLTAPAARAAVVWLAAAELGGLAGSAEAAALRAAAPHALRLVARTFPDEAEATKLALLGASAKLLLRAEAGEAARAAALYGHLLSLSDADASFDLRDRARLLRALLPPAGARGEGLGAHAAALLLAPQPQPPLPSPAQLRCAHALGSLSHAVQHTAPGYAPLPPHPEVPPPGSVRAAPPRGVPPPAAAAGGRRAPAAAAAAAGAFYSDSGSGSGSGSGSYSDSYSDEESSESDDGDSASEAGGGGGGGGGAQTEEVDDPRAWGEVPEEPPTERLQEARLEEEERQ